MYNNKFNHSSKTDWLKPHASGCPYLILAPMEGVGDRPFRKTMASIGGFDEAVTEFIRVPVNAHVESLAKVYESSELDSIPLAAQVMGSDPELVGKMGQELEKRGAPRIDLNCGCPSNTVTGKGAGSSLLKDPDSLYKVAKSLVDAVNVPVTVKMRSGYDDTSLFIENLEAAQSSGIKFITLHPRTKKDGYSEKANWDLIKSAKEKLKIPLIGNGDILSVNDALSMLEKTGCDALMIGRGSVRDPFIFKKIKNHFIKTPFEPSPLDYCQYLENFLNNLNPQTPTRNRINKLKQILGFVFTLNPKLASLRPTMLKITTNDPLIFLKTSQELLLKGLLESDL